MKAGKPSLSSLDPLNDFFLSFPLANPAPVSQQGKSINGFHDLKFNALSVYQLAEAINFLIGCNFSGTINVAGDYSISKYEFLNYIANYIGIDESLVIKSDSRDFFNVARPKNTTLSIKNIKQLGFTNLKLKEGMEYIANKIREV